MKPIGTSEKDERCKRKMELMALSGCQYGDIFVTFQKDLPGFYSLGEKPIKRFTFGKPDPETGEYPDIHSLYHDKARRLPNDTAYIPQGSTLKQIRKLFPKRWRAQGEYDDPKYTKKK